ncbi:MAG TPA: sulfurtransferase complex subunit TusD [Pseudomonadales bacterium]|nr:sulfurtransferase complex subunit TusD [Pseudomonadales bacterium]
MKFALLITAAPFSTQGAETALRFARAALSNGHSIERVFFFRDGVHNASTFAVAPQDEANVPTAWQQFCEAQAIDAVVCVSAALKRGIVDSNVGNISIAGLGLLTDAIINADRVLTFG